jgi:hypothetical protein
MESIEYKEMLERIDFLVSEDLTKKGFSGIKRIEEGSLNNYKAFKKGIKRIIKIPSYELFDLESFYKEVKYLNKIKGLKGVSNLIEVLELNFLLQEEIYPRAIVKEYIKGNSYSSQYLNIKQEQEALEVINEIHSQGIGDLDIKKNNYIYFPSRGLTFIDPFYDETVEFSEINSKREIERLKNEDLKSLEKLLSSN